MTLLAVPAAELEVDLRSEELLFSVNAVMTCLRVKRDLLISIASLNCVASYVASAIVVCDYLSLPAKSTSCSLLMMCAWAASVRVRSSCCTMKVRMQCERDDDWFMLWEDITLFLSPFQKYL